jgi:hypothetical protein
MDRVIDLLKEKNDYLEKFYAVNEHELINFVAGDFDNVELFYQTRDKILELINCVDGLLEEENERMVIGVTEAQRAQAAKLFAAKDQLVEAILAQDLQILEYIEKEKSNIIRELRTTRTARRVVGAYGAVERAKLMEE